ncbi:MAG TPA: amidohydrolase family protein [Candidatus Binataceae bacterium]|nr:amidohydrolase family protein [Candidatus Binataceae bacterium]
MPAGRHLVVDSDSHVFESAAIWDQYLDPAYRAAARSAFSYRLADDGRVAVTLNGKPAPPMNRGPLNRQAIWRPGMTPEQIGDIDPRRPCPINPGAQDAKARLADMDEMGIDRAVLFPTLFAEYFPLVEDPYIAASLARAYNDWIANFCRAAPARLYPVAVLPLQDVTFAIDELRRTAAAGFKASFVRPSFFQGRFLNHPDYDRLWAEAERIGTAVCIHPSPGTANPQWASQGAFVERVASNLRIGHNIAEAIAPFMDNATALTAFAFCGHMETFPKLKLVFAHSGASWVVLALEKAETYLTFFMIDKVCLEPEKIFFKRNYLVTFSPWESSITRLHDIVENIGAWGSRYPNHDAAPPADTERKLSAAKVPPAVIARFMGANAAAIYGMAPA